MMRFPPLSCFGWAIPRTLRGLVAQDASETPVRVQTTSLARLFKYPAGGNFIKSKLPILILLIITSTNLSNAQNDRTTTASDRKSVNVTIYNSNVGLVRETRLLDLPSGRINL